MNNTKIKLLAKIVIVILAITSLYSCLDLERSITNPYHPNYENPTKPTNFVASVIQLGKVKLTWTYNEETYNLNYRASFRIDRKVDGEDWQVEYKLTEKGIREWVDEESVVDNNIKYRIFSFFDDNFSSPKESNEVLSEFLDITNLNVNFPSITSVRFSWNESNNNEDGFIIEKKQVGYDWILNYDSTNANVTSWTDNLLDIEDKYIYRIFSHKNGFKSNVLRSDTTRTFFKQPDNLILSSTNFPIINLTWEDNIIGEEGFIIERKINNYEFEVIDTTLYDVTVYADRTFGEDNKNKDNQELYYRIKAFKGDDYFSQYEESNIDIELGRPTELTLNQQNYTSVYLSWLDNSNGEEGFVIEKMEINNSAIWEEIGVVQEGIQIFRDNNIEVNDSIKYTVYAYRGAMKSEYSDESEVLNIFLSVPENLSITQINTTTKFLSWDIDGDISFLDGVRIDRKEGEAGTWIEEYITLPANSNEWDDIDIDIQSKYYYKIYTYYEDYSSVKLEGEHQYEFDDIIVEFENITNNSSFAIGTNVDIEATIVSLDPLVSIQFVEFYINNELVNSDQSEPYEYLWNTSFNDIGEYNLKLRSVDNFGNEGIAEIIISLIE